MTFEQYMDEKIPTWKTQIAIEDVEELKQLYDTVNTWEKTIHNILNMSLKHNKAGIDYSNDLGKATQHLEISKMNLEEKISQICQKLGLDSTEKEEVNKTM